MKTYGYCRISTRKQSIERQIRNIQAEYPDAIIIQEAFTGTKIDRPEFSKMLKVLQAGDQVVFDSVSRMSRDAKEGFELYQKLYNQGISLVFLKEHHIDTDTFKTALKGHIEMTGTDADIILEAVNRYLMRLAEKQIEIAFEQSEKEVTDLHKRTSEGIETARRTGKQIGQKRGTQLTTKKSIEKKKEIVKLMEKHPDLSNEQLIKLTGLARNTLYKYLREMKEAGEI